MVKIIDGEIVADDDPRAVEWERRQRQSQGWSDPRLRNAASQQSQYGAPQGSGLGASSMFGMGNMMGGAAPNAQPGQHPQSPLQGINDRLSEMGLRPWNVGEYVVEPIFTVALVLALVFYGIKGMMVVGIVWYLFGRSNAAR